jgi:hypothetical protein
MATLIVILVIAYLIFRDWNSHKVADAAPSAKKGSVPWR